MTVRSILNTKGHHVVSIEPSAKLSLAVKTLAERKIGAILVVSADGALEGIVSERDIVRLLAEGGTKWLDESVSSAMTRKVVTCSKAATVSSVMEQMTAGKFRHVPVLDDERIVGIISIGDVIKYRLNEIERESQALREYITTA